MSNDIGSQWRKWDLHFHTPASFDYQTGGAPPGPEELVDRLRDRGVAAVAVTDHHVMDVDGIGRMMAYADGNPTILPGIELRSEYGKHPIHYIGVFPETSDLGELWDTIRVRLELNPSQIEKKGGNEGVYVNLREAREVFQELGGIISIHAGGKANSIEGISNVEQFQQRLKLDITRDYVDILEVGQLKDVLSYLNVVFPVTGIDRPLIIGSDNHDIQTYDAPPCWVKADPTFLGLRQVLNEPRSRVYLGSRPPQLEFLEQEATRFVSSIGIQKVPGSPLAEKWFDGVEISLNPGLVAIIGKQGSGKSALTDVLGLLGNCPHREGFAFLNSDQFLHPKSGKGEHFSATLTWADGQTTRRRLADDIPSGARETIKYIPQSHLDEICDELRGGRGGKFEEELKSVVFSLVPKDERSRKGSLDELISFRTKDARERLKTLKDDLENAASEFAAVELRAKPSHRASLEDELKIIKAQLETHEQAKPKEVEKPAAEDSEDQQQRRSQMEQLEEELATLDEAITSARTNLTDATQGLHTETQVRAAVKAFEESVAKLRERLAPDLETLGIEFSDLIKVTLDYAPLDGRRTSLKASQDEAKGKLDEEDGDSLIGQRQSTAESREKLKAELDLPAREYAAYQEALSKWQKAKDDLLGDNDTPETKAFVEAQIDKLSDVDKQLEECKTALRDIAIRIIAAKNRVLEVSEELHEPVRSYIANHPIAGQQLGLDFSISFVPKDFADRFLDFIHQRRKGSFYGEADGKERVGRLLAEATFTSQEGVLAFLESAMEALTSDLRREGERTFVSEQLRDAYSTEELLEYLFGMAYLEPRFELQWLGRSLEQLSPGERGTLLLIFFLLVDGSNIPLVIDQPEGNLDNQTVFELLVECIKDAKERRQIIMVTHNPNLAVVCDAEQVVLASLDKLAQNEVTYVTGSLESPQVGNRLVDVLEGTRPAIEKRMDKYRVIFDNGS